MNYHDIPDPDQTTEGRSKINAESSPLSPAKQAKKYRPKGADLEPPVSTIARFAGRLIDRLTGKAYSADDLLENDQNVVENEEAIHHFMDQLIALQTAEYPGDERYLVVGAGGDSMGTSSGFNPYITLEITRRIGQGCVGSPSFTGGNNLAERGGYDTTIVRSNGAVEAGVGPTFVDFRYLPNGKFTILPTSGIVTETPASSNISSGFRRIRCWYGIRAGGGTLTFTVTQNGVALTPKNVNTGTGTPNTIGYVDFVAADGLSLNGKPILTVSNATAESHYLGCYMYLGSGFVPVAVGMGDTDYAQHLQSPAANLATFCSAMDMRLCFHATKENGLETDLEAMMDRWAAQHPKCSHVWVGATPSPSQGVWDAESNAAMRAKAMALKMCFVDGQRLLRSVEYLNTIGSAAAGWNEPGGTGPHLSFPARRFIASWLIQKVLLGLHVPGGRFSPATLETVQAAILSNSRVQVPLGINTTINGAGSTFTHTPIDFSSNSAVNNTNTLGRFVIGFTASPAPVANTYRAGPIHNFGPSLNTRRIYRYMIGDGFLNDGIMAAILVGGNGQNEVMGISGALGGFRIIHGVDTISGQSVPFVQIGVKGAGSTEVVSPKLYHSSTVGVAPYNGGTWRPNTSNIYWVEVIGNGGNAGDTLKRFRVWHQSAASGSNETRVAVRRFIGDWSATITTSGATYGGQTFFGLFTNSSPGVPGGVRSIALDAFEVEIAPKFSTDFGQQDSSSL